jgi:hypothetical protein
MDSQPGTIWGREPAMVLALVQAVIALVVAFGLILSPDQIGAILAVTRSWASHPKRWSIQSRNSASLTSPLAMPRIT